MNRKKYLKILGGGVGAALLLPHTVFAQSKGKIVYGDNDIVIDGDEIEAKFLELESKINRANFLRLTDNLEMVQISGDGIIWKDWKYSGLLFDGYFIKDSMCNKIKLPNEFNKGLSITATSPGSYSDGAREASAESYSIDVINVSGYDVLRIEGSYRLAGYTKRSFSTGGDPSASSDVKVYILDGQTNNVLKKIDVASKSASRGSVGEGFSYDESKNFSQNIDLTTFSEKNIKIKIYAYSSGNSVGTYDGYAYGISTISLTNAYVY